MRLVFFGTPEFARASLQAVYQAGFEVCAVVTAPDKASGRGLQVQASPVKEWAEQKHLKVLQPTNLKSPEFNEELRGFRADVFVVVAFRMLPEAVWSMPPQGTFNLHASLLPMYRGAAPINWAIMNGESRTGLTTFFIRHEIDTGRIIFQDEMDIGEDETAGELHDRMMHRGAALVVKTLKALSENNSLNTVEQSQRMASGDHLPSAPKLFKEHGRLDLSRRVRDLHNQVRGLSPHPGAFLELYKDDGEEMTLKVYRTKPGAPGSVLSHELICSAEQIFVSAADGFLELLEVQLPGKRRMSSRDLLNGFKLDAGWRIR